MLINTFPGDNFGFAGRKGEEKLFMNSLQLSVDYCKALGCNLLHIMR